PAPATPASPFSATSHSTCPSCTPPCRISSPFPPRPAATASIFDRSNSLHPGGISANLRPDVYEMIWRLAGGNDDGFKLGYSDLVGILQGLSAAHHIPAT